MKHIIQKVPARDVSRILAAIPEALVVEDRDGAAVKCFIRSLEAADGEGHIHLEDDVEISSQYRQIIADGVAAFPDRLVSFFHIRKTAQDRVVRPGKQFRMAQCFYIPGEWLPPLIAYAKRWLVHPHDQDVLLADWMAENRLRWVTWHPCAVQHLAVTSQVDRRRSKYRQTLFFQP